MGNRRLVATVAGFCTLGLVTGLGVTALIGPASAAYGPKAKYDITLNGANEAPAQGDPDGAGFASVKVKGNASTVCVVIKKVTGVALPALAAHIHQGNAGTAGPIVVNLAPPTAKKVGKPGKSKACGVVDAALLDGLFNNPVNYYVNVHTSEFPNGAIRGQLALTYP
jgi:hypothetical protein